MARMPVLAATSRAVGSGLVGVGGLTQGVQVVAQAEQRHIELAERAPQQQEGAHGQQAQYNHGNRQQQAEGEGVADRDADGGADEAEHADRDHAQARPVDQVDDLAGHQLLEGEQIPEDRCSETALRCGFIGPHASSNGGESGNAHRAKPLPATGLNRNGPKAPQIDPTVRSRALGWISFWLMTGV